MHKILIATDSYDQVNGVSTTYRNILSHSAQKPFVVHPGLFKWRTFAIYPEVQICKEPLKAYKKIKEISPTHIHIGTEGPIGLAARIYCKLNRIPYTTGYHTKFPEFLWYMYKVPTFFTYPYMKWFHSKSSAVMVSTDSLKTDLEMRGFKNLTKWTRGVDLKEFYPAKNVIRNYWMWLYVGRISKEKNIEAFLSLNLPGIKVVVGDGPDLERLQRKYPEVRWMGKLTGDDLRAQYQNANVFVFPSKTDTFGLVLLEAMACGTPVAAYPVTGPIDVLGNSRAGAMSDDLREACLQALKIPREVARAHAEKFSWKAASEQFALHLKPVPSPEVHVTALA